ncbi:glyoxylate reductase [Dactylonectria macrodidyma]|uniref:Glyoxylate reductase n=1 Tax=Dactylonectria macrodidyma TaxID=307937 RepID=A0A9P9ERY9_9HYPO|nr:glyoxylate reductase [Dactylonectria macrodidyma]
MAAPSIMTTELLPRFLLPRLSWGAPLASARAVRPFPSVQPSDQRRSLSAIQAGPAARRCSHRVESPILRRAFHATALRQRDHHFDTLKFVKRLQSEGFTEEQSAAMMKVLNDVIEESIQNLTRTMILREDAAKATYTQKVDFAKLRSELLSADSTESNTTRTAHERLTNDIAKLSNRLRDEISRTQASVRLDLNLEKGRIREEAVGQELQIKETETKIEQEVAALREKLEQVKFQTLQWLMGVCTGFAALMLGAWRLLIAHSTWASLSSVAQIITPKATNREEFIHEASDGAFDGVVAAYRTFSSVSITGRIDAELIGSLPKTLKFICHNGAGYDQIDVAACTAQSIRVSNTPNAVDDATADLTIWLLLGALRNLPASMASLRRGAWRGNPTPRLGHDPQGKTLGILGMGGIGRNVARKARAFGMQIRYHNRSQLSPELEEGAEYVDFETLLRESDVLSLNLPLNPKTRHTISTPQFDLMKPGILIVNTARGAVMDEVALVQALEAGQVASVGLDVYENEPAIHPGLVENENVLLVPHMGTWTVETETKMEELAIGNVRLAAEEGRLKTIVPEQKELA